jgi:uncharacterized RDD family membrane protein YckC
MNTPPDEPQTAGFWIRMFASLFDIFLIFAFVYGPLMSIFGHELGLLHWAVDAVLVAFTVFMWQTRGGTPGKLLLGLRVVDAATLGPMTTPQALGRYFAYLISMLPLCLGFIWIALDRRHQAWHDKLASTLVIHAPRRPKEPALVETAKVVEPG